MARQKINEKKEGGYKKGHNSGKKSKKKSNPNSSQPKVAAVSSSGPRISADMAECIECHEKYSLNACYGEDGCRCRARVRGYRCCVCYEPVRAYTNRCPACGRKYTMQETETICGGKIRLLGSFQGKRGPVTTRKQKPDPRFAARF